jgi:hypothetical protein
LLQIPAALSKAPSSWGNVMKLARRAFLQSAVAAAALPSLPGILRAEDAYPSRTIYIIVGFTPGAAADVTARLLGDGLGRILGQQIVVESRPGAGSSIAADTFPICFAVAAVTSLGFWAASDLPTSRSSAQQGSRWS